MQRADKRQKYGYDRINESLPRRRPHSWHLLLLPSPGVLQQRMQWFFSGGFQCACSQQLYPSPDAECSRSENSPDDQASLEYGGSCHPVPAKQLSICCLRGSQRSAPESPIGQVAGIWGGMRRWLKL